ncbi:MAG: DUF2141 domain-containing protein [Chitinophagaceae bacterium]|nr:DUF2141 domain-containing protein [Chitinophagaceae bacterium]
MPMLFSYLFFILTLTPPPKSGELTISITDLKNKNGQVLVSLFKDGKGYPDKPDLAFKKGRASFVGNDKAVINFTGLQSGQYAAVILHDENSNLKMDKSWIGLPREGYGFSNNVMGSLGPPTFSKASFSHTAEEESEIIIKLRY